MFSDSLLMGTGISGLSTGLYAIFTTNDNETDKKDEYLKIFFIILLISFFILFIFNSGSESLIKKTISPPNVIGGGKPPF
jgi:hypothetical protein